MVIGAKLSLRSEVETTRMWDIDSPDLGEAVYWTNHSKGVENLDSSEGFMGWNTIRVEDTL